MTKLTKQNSKNERMSEQVGTRDERLCCGNISQNLGETFRTVTTAISTIPQTNVDCDQDRSQFKIVRLSPPPVIFSQHQDQSLVCMQVNSHSITMDPNLHLIHYIKMK